MTRLTSRNQPNLPESGCIKMREDFNVDVFDRHAKRIAAGLGAAGALAGVLLMGSSVHAPQTTGQSVSEAVQLGFGAVVGAIGGEVLGLVGATISFSAQIKKGN